VVKHNNFKPFQLVKIREIASPIRYRSGRGNPFSIRDKPLIDTNKKGLTFAKPFLYKS